MATWHKRDGSKTSYPPVTWPLPNLRELINTTIRKTQKGKS